jgi:hypothetical protein
MFPMFIYYIISSADKTHVYLYDYVKSIRYVITLHSTLSLVNHILSDDLSHILHTHISRYVLQYIPMGQRSLG